MAMSCRMGRLYPQFPQGPVYAWSVVHSGGGTRRGRFDGLSPVLIYCGARLARKSCLVRTQKKVFQVSGRRTHGYLVEAIRQAGPRDIGIQVRKCEEDLPTEQAQAQEDTRLQSAHEHEGRTRRIEAPALERPQATVCLTKVNRSRGRLTRSEDFGRVYRAGRSVVNKYLVLYYFERPSGAGGQAIEGPRVGYSVSKRLGGAVERNSVKRMLREGFRAMSDSVPSDMDLVFVARVPLVGLLEEGGLAAVQEKIVEVLGKASLAEPKKGSV